MHDLALPGLPVSFVIDCAGLVGADGAELVHMKAMAAAYNARPIAFRYPQSEGEGVNVPNTVQVWEGSQN